MNTLLLFAGVVIIGAVLFLALVKAKSTSREFPYQKSKYLLSKAERSFYGVLVQAVGSTGLVFPKVRVADVISPKKGLERSDWQRAFNAVSAKHFDFVICDPNDCSVKIAVELDDASHDSAKRQKRDKFLEGACESAGLPLLRVKAARGYVLADLRTQVLGLLQPNQSDAVLPPQPHDQEEATTVSQTSEAVAAPTDIPVESAEQQQPSPLPNEDAKSRTCPKCGQPMLLRKAKSGSNAGQEFWGCSAFPKCRTAVW